MVLYTSIGEYKSKWRDIARRVKIEDNKAIDIAVDALSKLIPPNSVLVPIPSHDGYPTNNLTICNTLKEKYGFKIADCLRCTPHQSLHTLKHIESEEGLPKGRLLPPPEELGFFLCCEPPTESIALIDNVVASGTTAMAAARLLPRAEIYCIASDETFPKIEGIRNKTNNSTLMYWINYNWATLAGPSKRFSIKCDTLEKAQDVFADLESLDGIYNLRHSRRKPKNTTELQYEDWEDKKIFKKEF